MSGLRIAHALAAAVALLAAPGVAAGDRDASALHREGLALWERGDRAGAAAKLRQAIVIESRAEIYLDLCHLLEEEGELGPALTACGAVDSAEKVRPELVAQANESMARIRSRLRGEPVAEPDAGAGPGPAEGPAPAGTGRPPPGPRGPEGPVAPPPTPEPRPAPARFGGVAGVGLSNVKVSGFDGTSSRSGPALGGVLHLRLRPALSLVTELFFARKGASFNFFLPEIGPVSIATELWYLEIPVLARVAVAAVGDNEFFAGGGLALSFLLSAESRFRGDGQEITEDIKDNVTDFDLGFVLGGGVAIPIGSGNLLLEARYELGLPNIDDTGEPDANIKNRTFFLLGGYLF